MFLNPLPNSVEISLEKKNVLTKFHEDWTINVTTIVLTMFNFIHIMKSDPPLIHEEWTINVTFRVLTRKTPSPLMAANCFTNFIMTKFYKDWIINTSRVILTSCDPDKSKFHKDQTTRQNIDDGDRQKVIPKAHHENAVLR
ncbi:hypothetical protein DPMN_062620 [Dreissena polymorpha]|uniref:Uncharacterized protein n=1 Tax=Dreissena polymorpha TaxID=45954 RepID=A0A9D4HJF6_DREPO|nr:hypothetical protein DPMN_062620 [Dreissena polymorpha]